MSKGKAPSFTVAPRMFLDKWYADVVSDNSLTVLYRAQLRLALLRWGYQGVLRNGHTRQGAFSWNRPKDGFPELPVAEQELIFGAATGPAIWQGVKTCSFELWTNGRQRVVWQPLVLNGPVTGSLRGQGYAERLTMDVEPWKLGLKRLWWGRFCGERHSLVWISWEGRVPLHLVLLDGEKLSKLDVADERVCAEDYRLDIRQPELIANTPIGAGALARMGWPKRLAPANFLNGQERKVFAQGVLSKAGVCADRGSVVCERVDWP